MAKTFPTDTRTEAGRKITPSRIDDATWLATMPDAELREYVLGCLPGDFPGVRKAWTTQRLRERAIFVTMFVMDYTEGPADDDLTDEDGIDGPFEARIEKWDAQSASPQSVVAAVDLPANSARKLPKSAAAPSDGNPLFDLGVKLTRDEMARRAGQDDGATMQTLADLLLGSR